MPALQDVFSVLKHNLNKGPVVSSHHRRVAADVSRDGRGVRDAPDAEHPVDVEVVRQLKGRVGWHERHAVYSVALLAVEQPGRVAYPNSTRHVDLAVVVRPLRIRPRSTRCQISPVTKIRKFCYS